MSTPNTCDLFNRCLAGRRGGDWQQFVDDHGRRVRKLVRTTSERRGLQLSRPDLDDSVQELYCRLLTGRRAAPRIRTEAQLWRYLGRVIHSLVVDRLRKLNSRKRSPDPDRPDAARLESPKLDPEERLLDRERRRLFFDRCLEIVRCDRVVLELRALGLAFLEGWTSHEIAGQMQGRLNAAQIDALVFKLRRHLARDGILLPRRGCVGVVPA